jgi:hypothetical protein
MTPLSSLPTFIKSEYRRRLLRWIFFPARRFPIFFRSISFGIFTSIGLDGVTPNEPVKLLMYKSHRLALAHCAVHVLPACVSVAIISINMKTFFIGTELEGFTDTDGIKFFVLQVLAKGQVRPYPFHPLITHLRYID